MRREKIRLVDDGLAFKVDDIIQLKVESAYDQYAFNRDVEIFDYLRIVLDGQRIANHLFFCLIFS